ncbi:FAD-dependent oxidoreductase [Vibrio harveyi]|nr:FAD-dependent oxidoreductase [Vibrio harveyi]
MRVVIIGGAASGMTVASRIKKLSNQTEVIVIQKENYVSLGACGLPYFVSNKNLQPNNLLARSVEQFNEQNIVIHTNSVVEKIDDQSKKI